MKYPKFSSLNLLIHDLTRSFMICLTREWMSLANLSFLLKNNLWIFNLLFGDGAVQGACGSIRSTFSGFNLGRGLSSDYTRFLSKNDKFTHTYIFEVKNSFVFHSLGNRHLTTIRAFILAVPDIEVAALLNCYITFFFDFMNTDKCSRSLGRFNLKTACFALWFGENSEKFRHLSRSSNYLMLKRALWEVKG